jgi:hypothetical protein
MIISGLSQHNFLDTKVIWARQKLGRKEAMKSDVRNRKNESAQPQTVKFLLHRRPMRQSRYNLSKSGITDSRQKKQ